MSSLQGMSPGAGENPDLIAVHRELIALVARLELSMDSAPDPAAITAISEQMAEVNVRVTSVGRVLLARQTEEIALRAKAVSDALPAIEREIDDLEGCQRMVRSVAALLGTVDEVVRVATLVGP